MDGSEKTHYDVLGVAPSASNGEIRRAYLEAARRSHPDVAGDAGEERMRQINEAWATLSDPEARAFYDHIRPLSPEEEARLHQANPGAWSGPTPPPRINNPPKTEFVPKFGTDEDDDDSWRFEPDEGDPATAPPRALLIAPPALFVLGVVLVVVSLTTGIDALTALGLGCLGFSALCFVGAPVVAMFRSQIVEERSRSRH